MTDDRSVPLVSVVLPVHATPVAFLREAIESVMAQTEQRWELVIVLDAATEECGAAAREMASQDPERIKVVGAAGGAPRGLSGARNFGVSSSRAPVIAFLDADDVFEPDRLGARLRLLDVHPEAAMAYGSTLYWRSWTGKPGDRDGDRIPKLGVEPERLHRPPIPLTRFVDGTASVPCPCSILVRRWAMDAVGGCDETFRDLYEDQVLYARLGLRFPFVADERVLDRYRQHPDSMTALAAVSDERRARMRFLTWLESEMAAIAVEDAGLRTAIEREKWKLRHPHVARAIRLTKRGVRRAIARLSRGRRGGR